MTTEERIDKLEKRVDRLEDNLSEQDKNQLKDKYELKELITKAVEEGNEKIIKKIEQHEQRIIKLENNDGEKAKLILKSICATTLGWLVLGFLNNFLTVLGR